MVEASIYGPVGVKFKLVVGAKNSDAVFPDVKTIVLKCFCWNIYWSLIVVFFLSHKACIIEMKMSQDSK